MNKIALNQFRIALSVLDTALSDTPGSAGVRVRIRKLIYKSLYNASLSNNDFHEYKDAWNEITDDIDKIFLVSHSRVSVALHCVFEALEVLKELSLSPADGLAGKGNQ